MATTARKPKKDQIVKRIGDFISRFIVMPAEELLIVSHYVLHTHQFSERVEQPNATPYLYIYSAQKRSGKTLLGIDILGTLCRNFQGVNNVTSATLFRLSATRCTLAIDEVDTIFNSRGSKNDDLVSSMNTGYRKGGYVPRVDPKTQEVIQFSTFCPKILIGIDNGMLKDTTRDRCIPIHMHRATDAESASVEKFYHYRVEDEIEAIGQELYDWSFAHGTGIRDYDPAEMDVDNDRAFEVSVPLLQIAHQTGYEGELREALEKVFAENAAPENSPEMDMLLMIRDHFEEIGQDRTTTEAILLHLQTDQRFRGLTGKGLKTKLDTFSIENKAIRFPRIGVKRGYELSAFADAFARYLDAE